MKKLARARKRGFSTILLNTIAVPKNILKDFYRTFPEQQIEKFFGGYGKFRIDFLKTKANIRSNTLNAIEKIIFRGKITRLSRRLEEIVKEITGGKEFAVANGEDVKKVRNIFDAGYDGVVPEQWFDGEKWAEFHGMGAEEYVFKEILVPEVRKFGVKNLKDIVPQVYFSSLNEKEKDERRVDFLITHGERGIVIEVDDATHKDERERDKIRDNELREQGIEVIRITTEQLKKGETEKLRKEVASLYREYEKEEKTKMDFLVGVKFAHFIQAILVKMMSEGVDFLNGEVEFSEELFMNLPREVAKKIIEAAILDLKDLSKNVAKIFNEEDIFSNLKMGEQGVLVVKNFKEDDARRQVLAQEISFPGEILNFSNRIFNWKVEKVKEENITFLLDYIFGFLEFRDNQDAGIKKGLLKEDAIVLLPTGSGKTIIYQLLMMILPGTGVVVEPLKALMEDQVSNLKMQGIDIVVNVSNNNSRESKSKIFDDIKAGKFGMIYVTPERIQMEDFRAMIFEAKEGGVGFPICAFDEAHCVSEWGHDFRTSYLNLADTTRKLFRNYEKNPTILALTGTASDSVLKDMERDLKIAEENVIRPKSFDRPEIEYRILKVDSDQKMEKLKQILSREVPEEFDLKDRSELMKPNGKDTKAGVVFCVYKTGKTDFGVNAVYNKLRKNGWEYVGKYYGTDKEKKIVKQAAADFKADRISLMVATKAFGMGIDKPNIRYVVHYGIPNSIEAFYQEAGRAGRDGKRAVSYILLSDNMPERNKELTGRVGAEDLKKILQNMAKRGRDDVNRLLFLHQRNFNQRETLTVFEKVIEEIGLFPGRKKVVAENGRDFQERQKVLFRMKEIGMIDDYVVSDYANREVKVTMSEFSKGRIIEKYSEYVGRYQIGQVKIEVGKLEKNRGKDDKEFVLEAMKTMLQFVDNVFEKSRRRAIGNMLQLAEEVAEIKDKKEQSKVFRRKILNHLGSTYEDLIRKILDDEDLFEVEKIVCGLAGKDEVGFLAEVKRSLQSYPEHVGLLFAAGVLGAINTDKNETVVEDLDFGLKIMEENGRRTEGEEVLVRMIGETCRKNKDREKYKKFIEFFVRGKKNEFLEKILAVVPKEYTGKIGAKLLREYNFERIKRIKSTIGLELWKKEN